MSGRAVAIRSISVRLPSSVAPLASATPDARGSVAPSASGSEYGRPISSWSAPASAGLDYPGVGPQIAALAAAGRLELSAATDGEAFEAMRWLGRTEGILPALESAHALAALPRILAGTEGAGADWPEEAVVLVGLSGRGDKDLATFGRWHEAHAS